MTVAAGRCNGQGECPREAVGTPLRGKILHAYFRPVPSRHDSFFAVVSEAHGVNLGWLLEGAGPMFKSEHRQ
jgi:hypothetical protein